MQALEDQAEVPCMREAAEQLHRAHAGRPMRMQVAQHPDLLRSMEHPEPHADCGMTDDFTRHGSWDGMNVITLLPGDVRCQQKQKPFWPAL